MELKLLIGVLLLYLPIVIVQGSCEGSFHSPQGQLNSPNYPMNYDDNLDCEWNISVPDGFILLEFSDFQTESCTYDWLKIYNANTGNLTKTLCGSLGQYSVSTLTNHVRLVFQTDHNTGYKGWNMTWSITPPKLTISGEEPKLAEGKEFKFTCSSYRASPAPAFSYEVLRNGEIIANNNTYTPVKEDRDGFTVRCTDTAHEDTYPGEVDAEMELQPNWLNFMGENNRTITLNPGGDNTLSCDVIGYIEGDITYHWLYNGSGIAITSHIHLPEGSRAPGHKETISCTTYTDAFDPVTIQWFITWFTATTLPPTTVTTQEASRPTTVTTQEPTSPLVTALAVINGILAVALAIVSFVHCQHRRKCGMSEEKLTRQNVVRGGSTGNQMELHPLQGGDGDGGDNYTSIDASGSELHPYARLAADHAPDYENLEPK